MARELQMSPRMHQEEGALSVPPPGTQGRLVNPLPQRSRCQALTTTHAKPRLCMHFALGKQNQNKLRNHINNYSELQLMNMTV